MSEAQDSAVSASHISGSQGSERLISVGLRDGTSEKRRACWVDQIKKRKASLLQCQFRVLDEEKL